MCRAGWVPNMLEAMDLLTRDKAIDDIFLVGFVDISEGVAQFCHDLRYVYIKFGEKYIELESIEQFSKMRIRIVDSLQYDFEIDEDWMKAYSSVSELILNDTMSIGNKIKNIFFYNLTENICDALEICLENGQVLFFDPTFYFGINIGGIKQRKMWEENRVIDNVIIQSLYIKA